MSKNNLIKNSKPICVWKSRLFLGEGTLWVPTKKSIFLVDIKKKKILILNIKSGKKEILKVEKEIGFISHIKDDIFLLGLKSELRIVDLKNLEIFSSIKIESNKSYNRINDGKIDPEGHLWFGTMDNLQKRQSGSLYCLDSHLKLRKVDEGYFVPNGPAFLNKNNFYHTDSRKRIIYKIKVNNKLKIIEKNVFIKFDEKEGAPDGMTTDVKNNLWVCHYYGAKITVYNLRGNKIHEIKLPAKNITNCTFGGANNNELYVSTARKGMTTKEIKKYPLSGGLFKIKINQKGKNSESFKIPQSIF